MFKAAIDDHKQTLVLLKANLESERKGATDAAEHLTDLLLQDIDSGARQVYSQQQEIAEELRRLRVAVKKAAQLAERQRVAVEKVDSALRELGDSENYMQVIADTMTSLSEAAQQLAAQREASQDAKP